MKSSRRQLLSWIIAIGWLAACQPISESQIPTTLPANSPAVSATPTALPSATLSPSSTWTAVPTGTPTAVPVACSPLPGFALSELDDPDLLKGTFEAPRPGYDDGHHGLDFAYWTDDQGQPMLGLPVLSVLAGRISAVLPDRQPYGNAVIIETPLRLLPPAWVAKIPTVELSLLPAISLECPPYEFSVPSEERSLYLLYGHLNQLPSLEIGQEIGCGDPVGEVGTTGRSVNPHLHLEMRLGPSGVLFPVMGHYTNDTTAEERRQYCIWRVSGAFQPLDPLPLLLP